jgi:uncharacterized protein (TIGR03435 family)
MRTIASANLILITSLQAFGQLSPLPPTFEVASVKPVELTPGNYRANLGTIRHGEVTMTNVTLSDCLRFAYGITNDAQISGPDWIKNKDVRFHIVAKAAPDTPSNQLLLMLQALLKERFQLAYHREQRQLAFLALMVGKKGPRLREAQAGSDASANRFGLGRISSNGLTMPVLATVLSRFMRQPVLDMTGLDGSYDVNLEWTPEAVAVGGDTPEATGATIFTALQEQLGLKLEARKGPLEVIVVDHAEKVPTKN